MAWSTLVAAGDKPGARDMASGNVVDNEMYMFGGYCGAAIDTFFKLRIRNSFIIYIYLYFTYLSLM